MTKTKDADLQRIYKLLAEKQQKDKEESRDDHKLVQVADPVTQQASQAREDRLLKAFEEKTTEVINLKIELSQTQANLQRLQKLPS